MDRSRRAPDRPSFPRLSSPLTASVPASRAARALAGALVLASLSALSSAQSGALGMTATVIGAKEVAGTSASQHACKVRVYFSGGNSSGNYPNARWTFTTTGAVQSGAGVTNGTVLEFTFPASTVASGTFDGVLLGTDTETGYDQYGNPVSVNYRQSVSYTPFRLRRFPVDVVAVDSRKTYAPPDKDGAYPAVDPNADLRNVAFAGWSYHGGLFVGNAAGVGGDQSGVARLQCLASDPGNVPACVYTLSLLQIGAPSFFNAAKRDWDASLTLQAMVPSGAFVPTANAQVTWATALDPSLATGVGSLDLSSSPSNEYVNVPIASGFPACVLLKAADEASPAWRYFGGAPYSPPSPVYPYSECKPHLWGCDVPTATGSDLNVTYTGGGGTGGGGGGGGTSPGGPTNPGGPTQPTGPTRPTQPTNPTQPGSGADAMAARAKAAKQPAPKPIPAKRLPSKPVKAKKKVATRKGAR